ncbi:MAG: DUF1207 domain-containing protein [Minwuiales bacterium]|nr:DUF1207 domain-containing protein [Minwuiales bacterium]
MTRSIRPGRPLVRLAAGLLFGLAAATAAQADDRFIAGYAVAILDREFGLTSALVEVQDGVITVRADGLPDAERDRVITVLSTIPDVAGVIVAAAPSEAEATVTTTAEQRGDTGASEALTPPAEAEFLPDGRLFQPLLADPRWPHFSAAYQRYVDDEELQNAGAVSFGETFPLYRDRAPFDGQWEVGVQAAVFAIFDLDAESSDLINSDFWVGIPLSYRSGNFSAITRIFHQSSHLGDEFLLRDRVDRVNLSYEAVDLIASYDLDGVVRFYGGGGVLIHREPSDLDRLSTQVGVEVRSPTTYLGGALRPIFGADFQNRQESDWETDISIRAGVQLESVELITRRIQLLVEYYDGKNPNGQFYERDIQSLGIGAHLRF